MRVALVHDYLYTYGGAERVLQALHEIWPEAPIYTAWVDWQWLKMSTFQWTIVHQKVDIHTSWFDKVPFKKQLCSPLRFLTPLIWKSFYKELAKYDVVISSSAWYMCKGVSLCKIKNPACGSGNFTVRFNRTVSKPDPSAGRQNSKLKSINHQPSHFCYCHTPPRYLYGYPTAQNFQKYWWGRLYANLVNPFMRYYDFKSSQSVDYFICNSKEVQKRILKFYRRRAKVIYPPVFTKFHLRGAPEIKLKTQNSNLKTTAQNLKTLKSGNYFLMVNRLVEPKNIDLAIKACKKLKLNLKIVGTGPDEKRLKEIAGENPYIKFLGYVDDKDLGLLYANCQAVLYLAEHEDFGITPVEAMSFGKPVIALRSGGVKESVIEGRTGVFIEKPEFNQLIKCLKGLRFKKFKPNDCLKQAEQFSKERFKKEIKTFIQANL